MRKRKRLNSQRCRFRNNRHKHTGTDSGSAGSPKATSPTGNTFPPVHHFGQCLPQINVTSGIFISRQQSRTDHYMMFRPMHMTEWLLHHPLYNLNRILWNLFQAHPDNDIHSGSMALITYIMPFYASGLTCLLLMAYDTLHYLICLQIFKRRFTYQAFFLHKRSLLP